MKERGTQVSPRSSAGALVWLVPGDSSAPAGEDALVRAGFRVVRGGWSSPEIGRKKKVPPDAVVVDLSRTPSVGRDIAVAMRSHRALVAVPFVLVGGSAEQVARIKTLLPDALCSDWKRIGRDIRNAIASPPVGARQLAVFDAYAETPLWKKLGVKQGSRIVAVNGPSDLAAILGELPPGAAVSSSTNGERDLTLWFAESEAEVRARVRAMARFAQSGGLWIMWRKGGVGDGAANQITVRKAGLACGLVDFKIARIDQTWSGLRFTRRAPG